jgi:nicotinate-nucleotide adenylyltransferase
MSAPRIGILGGTFDPIHVGHVETASLVRRRLGLDRVLLVPSRIPPHRSPAPLVSPFHRFAMTALASLEAPELEASDMELLREGPSYTAVTLRELHAQGLAPSQLFFITGADAFADIATWHDYPGLLDLAHFVVVARAGMTFDALMARRPDLGSRWQRLPGDPAGAMAVGRPDLGRPRILLVDAETPDVSATEVRQRLARGLAVEGLLTPLVAAYVLRHSLYAPGPAPVPVSGGPTLA